MIPQSVFFLHTELVRTFYYEGPFQIRSFKFQHVLSWDVALWWNTWVVCNSRVDHTSVTP